MNRDILLYSCLQLSFADYLKCSGFSNNHFTRTLDVVGWKFRKDIAWKTLSLPLSGIWPINWQLDCFHSQVYHTNWEKLEAW